MHPPDWHLVPHWSHPVQSVIWCTPTLPSTSTTAAEGSATQASCSCLVLFIFAICIAGGHLARWRIVLLWIWVHVAAGSMAESAAVFSPWNVRLKILSLACIYGISWYCSFRWKWKWKLVISKDQRLQSISCALEPEASTPILNPAKDWLFGKSMSLFVYLPTLSIYLSV